MRILTEVFNGSSGLALAGRFDAHETAGFRAAVEDLGVRDSGPLRLEMSQVIFVDSSALAELVRLQRDAADRGTSVVLVNVSDPVRIILELTNLAPIFLLETASQGTAPAP